MTGCAAGLWDCSIADDKILVSIHSAASHLKFNGNYEDFQKTIY
jgi:hypothetical protein